MTFPGQDFLLAHLQESILDDLTKLLQSRHVAAHHRKADVASCVFLFSSQRWTGLHQFLLPFCVCLSSRLLGGQKEDFFQYFYPAKAENPGKQFLIFFLGLERQIVSVSSNQNLRLVRFRLAREVARKGLSEESFSRNLFSRSDNRIFLF